MQVKTTEGLLEGEIVNNDILGTYYSFKGIPYAAPPLGDLRFKAPQPPKPWEGVRSAKEHGSSSYQFNFLTKTREIGSEDCLYLNVYTPNTKPSEPLPVMIWIHGGAFCCGSGNDDIYGPEFLIKHDVVLVTINYRLEILGFLCLETEDVPGNAGIKDQVAAMRWVNKNIANFGGDPNNVTIFGQSAGAACVTYHCISPTTKGLFKRAIAQSGSIINWWTQGFRPRDRAEALARKLGCNSKDDKELYEFFKSQPVENLAEIQVPLTYKEYHCDKYETQFSLVVEKEFPNVESYFTGNIMEALKTGIHEGVELIIGYNGDEGIINVGVSFDIKKTISQANTFLEYFVPKFLIYHCSPDQQLEIGKAMKQFYMKNDILVESNLEPLVKYFATDMYKFGLLTIAKYFSLKNKVYFYKFTCKTERNFFSKIMDVAKYLGNRQVTGHIDEIPYLFPVKSIHQKVGSETQKCIDTLSKLWTNFAKMGNPTPDATLGVNWKQFRADMPSFLEIGNTLVRGVAPDKEELTFWEGIFEKYLPSMVFHKETS